MKIVHVLGHNSNWNIESYFNQEIGDEFLITAFTFGSNYLSNKRIQQIIDLSMIDLQFYGKKSKISAGKLNTFDFHPQNGNADETTNIYINNCIKSAINYQIENGFKKIIIPLCYESDDWNEITPIIKDINRFISTRKEEGLKFYMTIPFSYDVARDSDMIDDILFMLTDMSINFDGYFIVCENKPEQGNKLTIDNKLITNLSTILKTLKGQGFETIYAYANWDAIIYLAQTDIDYITIGTYENLRNFSIRRFTEDTSGGKSDGYYFSEKLLNMIRAKDITNIRGNGMLKNIENDKNIFSSLILDRDYSWNIHKPDVNKNYFLSISRLLLEISQIKNIQQRTLYVLFLIQDAIDLYEDLDNNYIAFGGSESKNYHLDVWKQLLLKSIQMKPSKFMDKFKEAKSLL